MKIDEIDENLDENGVEIFICTGAGGRVSSLFSSMGSVPVSNSAGSVVATRLELGIEMVRGVETPRCLRVVAPRLRNGLNWLELVGRRCHERAMISVRKVIAAFLLWQSVWMTWAAPLSQSSYTMKGEMRWTTGTNTSTSAVQVTRDGGVLKILQVTEESPTNFNAAGFIATPAMAVSFYQYSKDIKGSDRPHGISNNGQVSVSRFRMPEMAQLPPIWLMASAAEEFGGDADRPGPSIYPQFPLTSLHERGHIARRLFAREKPV